MTNYGCLYAYHKANSENWRMTKTYEEETYARSWKMADSYTATTFRTVQE